MKGPVCGLSSASRMCVVPRTAHDVCSHINESEGNYRKTQLDISLVSERVMNRAPFVLKSSRKRKLPVACRLDWSGAWRAIEATRSSVMMVSSGSERNCAQKVDQKMWCYSRKRIRWRQSAIFNQNRSKNKTTTILKPLEVSRISPFIICQSRATEFPLSSMCEFSINCVFCSNRCFTRNHMLNRKRLISC